VNGNYIAKEIVVMDINNSFQRYNYELPRNQTCNIVRAELNKGLEDLKFLRLHFVTNRQPLTIGRLKTYKRVTIIPMERSVNQDIVQQTSSEFSQQNNRNLIQQNDENYSHSVPASSPRNERDKFFDNVTLPPKEHQSHADSSLPKHAPVANEYSNTDKIRNQYNEKSDNQYQSINSPQRETYEDLDNLQSNRSNRHFSGTPSMPKKSQMPTHSFSSHAYEDTMPAQTDTQPRLPVSSFSVNAVSGNSHVYYMKSLQRRPKRQMKILQVVSQDKFNSTEEKYYDYDYENLLVKDFYSPYFYVFSRVNGNHLEVFHKTDGNMVFQTPLTAMPLWRELKIHSAEFSSPQSTIFAFNMPGQTVGLYNG